ncbi:NAD-dependent epimerase/dehydratase family protein [Arthrobacter sunyaminii]|uniref:NAD-dependent epimerase/dehydratase family protein n=1 Tax=Arthrobacter sunyaminii TaxID=2816859 RepID=UPI001A94D2A8|nr:NAD-dependent epimerase/dehydratase family protein [Arthrobacter sunyaminii]MBO0896927.1 NAD-dependent epimerase/dehydratase family protein [Arthrobacter sunyaminii]
MKTAVAGGAGFIGSHLSEYLLAAGDHVTVLDDLSTGSLENLRGVLDRPGVRLVEGTILDRTAADSVIAGADRLFHLAAAVGVMLMSKTRSSLRQYPGTEVVLDATLAAGACGYCVAFQPPMVLPEPRTVWPGWSPRRRVPTFRKEAEPATGGLVQFEGL